MFVAQQRRCLHAISARVVAKDGRRLRLAIIQLVDARPLRPRVVGRPRFRRLGHDLELHQAAAAVAQRRGHAVGAGVAAADDDHVAAGGREVVAVGLAGVEQMARIAAQELHREVDATQLAAGHAQVAWPRRAGAEDDSVKVAPQRVGGHVLADADAGNEAHPPGPQHVHPPLDQRLVELHVGDAVHQQPADTIGALKDGHFVADGVELVGAGQPGRPGADDSHALAGAAGGCGRANPALVEGAVDDSVFDALDRHRWVGDAQRAGRLARRGADQAGELREVVGLGQAVIRLPPQAAIDEVVPLRDEVVDRAAGGHAGQRLPLVAERDATIHTAGGLLLQPLIRQMQVDRLPVADALGNRPLPRRFAGEGHEASYLAHD